MLDPPRAIGWLTGQAGHATGLAALPHTTSEERRVAYEEQLRAAVHDQLVHDQAHRERAAFERERRQEAVAGPRRSRGSRAGPAGAAVRRLRQAGGGRVVRGVCDSQRSRGPDGRGGADGGAGPGAVAAAAQGATEETLALLARLTVENVGRDGRAGFRASRRVISVMDGQLISDSPTCGSRSWPRQCRRARMIQDRERSTTQRWGRTMKPAVFGGLRTVFRVMFRRSLAQVTSCPA